MANLIFAAPAVPVYRSVQANEKHVNFESSKNIYSSESVSRSSSTVSKEVVDGREIPRANQISSGMYL